MRQILNLLDRFRRDERGAFAVIFGLMAIVLVALSGAVVDYVSLEQMRNRGQLALDAAALALQPEVFKTPLDKAGIQAKAQAVVIERIGDSRINAAIETTTIDVANGSLYFEAKISMPTIFVQLVGVPKLDARIHSQATRKKLALEVAFVLDNSGSMSYTGAGANGTRQRIQFLKDAADCATNILFYDKVVDNPNNKDTCIPASGATKVDNTRLAVVPFTMFVNVGASNASANWMDKTGASVISNDNFDTDDDETTLPGNPPESAVPNRFTLFSRTGVSWRGCVEARPHIKTGATSDEYLDTDDTTPVANNTLFVPLFSPDLVDGVGGNSYLNDSPAVCDRPTAGAGNCSQSQLRTSCNSGMSNGSCTTQNASTPTPSGSVNLSSNEKYSGGYYGAHAPSCDCRNWSNWSNYSQISGSGNNRTFERTRSCSGGGYVPTGLSNRELQERICKYSQNAPNDYSSGPNADCTRTAILPLSNVPATVIATIDSMQAEGGTNIHEGTVWGYRVLSPGAPFTQGDAFGTATSKVMIMMTDGENTAYNLSNYCNGTQRGLDGNCYNSAYGFPYNSRNNSTNSSSGGNIERMGTLGTNNGDLVTEMNKRTSQTCENAKNAGITVYTIGLATDQAQQSTQAVVEKMLSECASSNERAFFPKTPGELRAVFESIANDLSALRLSQ
ncbi:MAG: hypothetical protein ACOH2L_04325 [Devosia sp.]